MTYTKVGPFTNGSASPPINAAFLNGVETALTATWVSYSPTGNWTGGSGAVSSFYYYAANGTITVRGRGRMGSSPAVPFRFEIPLPTGFTYLGQGVLHGCGNAVFVHGTAIYSAFASVVNVSNGSILDTTPPDTVVVYGTGSNGAAIDPNSVFTWASGDYFDFTVIVPIL